MFTLTNLEYFDISAVFDCGQCFRFTLLPCGEGIEARGVVRFPNGSRALRVIQSRPGELCFPDADEAEFEAVWKKYLSLDADYGAIRADILYRIPGSYMQAAAEAGKGIRLLRQDAWEAVASFIISQNNNIPRIKKIIDSLCRTCGSPLEAPWGEEYSFPSPARLLAVGAEGLAPCRMGFRVPYILSAAEFFASGEAETALRLCKTSSEASEILMKIHGVGPKVANCAALFGLGLTDAFPVDVWIKRVLAAEFPDGLDLSALGAYAGIAQQYMFYGATKK